MKTILLKFAGPLQSWGTDSRFETRYTDRYPSKSGVIGLIAAALGYRRDEDEKLQQLSALDFAVRVDKLGTLLRDYHIARSYQPEKRFGTKKANEPGAERKVSRTYVTNRYYLQDAVFAVAVGCEDHAFAEEIESALKKPYFQLFLGRRSIPVNADFFIKTVDTGAIEALEQLDWQVSESYRKYYTSRQSEEVLLDIYADSDLVDSKNSMMTRDLPVSFSAAMRRHAFRPVARTQVRKKLHCKNDEHDEHDAFAAIGGD